MKIVQPWAQQNIPKQKCSETLKWLELVMI